MCDLCKQYPCISQRCPNYSPIVSHCKCDLCGDPIEIGEEYIEAYNGNFAHVECCGLFGISEMLKFLDIDVITMEEK